MWDLKHFKKEGKIVTLKLSTNSSISSSPRNPKLHPVLRTTQKVTIRPQSSRQNVTTGSDFMTKEIMFYQNILIFVVIFTIWLCFLRWQRRKKIQSCNQFKNGIWKAPIIGHAYLMLGNAESKYLETSQRLSRPIVYKNEP